MPPKVGRVQLPEGGSAVQILQQRLTRERISNVELVLGTFDDPRLPVVSFTGSGPVGARIQAAVPHPAGRAGPSHS